jgi:hypothetical protein
VGQYTTLICADIHLISCLSKGPQKDEFQKFKGVLVLSKLSMRVDEIHANDDTKVSVMDLEWLRLPYYDSWMPTLLH